MRDPRLTAEEELALRQQYGLLDFEEPIPDILLAPGTEDAGPGHDQDDDGGDE